MMTFTMYCTAMWLDGKKELKAEIARLILCVIIASYAYIETTLSLIAISVFIYSSANLLIVIYLNKTNVVLASDQI